MTDPAQIARRETMQQLYIRCCRDSGFRMDWINAARLAAKACGAHPIEVWNAMPSMDVMQEIAAGTHPAAHRPYAATPDA